MARTFTGTNKIDCGSGSTLDSLAPGPFSGCCWLFLTTGNDAGRIFFKMTAGFATGWTFAIDANNNLNYSEKRATTNRQQFSATDSISLTAWTFVAFTVASSLLAADVHFFIATGSAALAEASYQTPVDGVGAYVDDAAESLIIGNNVDGSEPFLGRLAEPGIWNSILTVNQFESLRRNTMPSWSPRGRWPIWGVASPEPDLSGNGNHGTVTGAVKADHAPVGRYAPRRAQPLWI